MKLLMNPVPVDILAIGVHPDDIELSCSGTLLQHIQMGYTVGLLDLTKGELGTRGNPEIRSEEAMQAAELLGAQFRVQLDLADGFFTWDKSSIIKIIQLIRSTQATIIFANALSDRHPDHGRSAKLVSDAVFYSGLEKIKTWDHKQDLQLRWRPKFVYHYIQDHQLKADITVDISNLMEKKLELIKCFKSQFYNPNSTELDSPISGEHFFDEIKAKHRLYGRLMGVEYAEGFNHSIPLPMKDLLIHLP
jgi:N-acetylglucosamine malate deacetylase 1